MKGNVDQKFINVPKILVELVEKSDELIQNNVSRPPEEKEWFKIILEMAQKITDGGYAPGESNTSTKGLSKSVSEFSPSCIPSCLTLVKGETEKWSSRVSSFFPVLERDHLHKNKKAPNGKSSQQKRTSSFHLNGKKIQMLNVSNGSGGNVSTENILSTSRKASTRGKKSSTRAGKGLLNSPIASRKQSMRGEKNSERIENGPMTSGNLPTPKNASARGKRSSPRFENDPDVVIVEKTQVDSGLDRTFVKPNSNDKFVTPVRKSKGTPLHLKSKRKSSIPGRNLSKATPLEQEMLQKRLRGMSTHSSKANLVIRTSRFSMGKKKYSSVKENVPSSAMHARCSSKASVTGKKEILQCKEDIAAENLKKLQDARNKKIEEKKRLRDEKMERTKEKRMKLEKAKALSAKKKATEPTTRSTRAQEKSAERTTRSKGPSGKSPSIAKAKISQTDSKKRIGRSESKKPTPSLKTPSSKNTPASSNNRTPAPPMKNSVPNRTPASSKGRRPTPPMQSQPLTVTPIIISRHNSTITVKKKTGSGGSLKRSLTPTSPPVLKAISKLKAESMSISAKKTSESSSKKPKLETPSNTPQRQTLTKKPDSYQLTPERSSFTSYDMSEIVSDDDDDTSSVQKPVPSWAQGLRLRNALIHQYYHPADTDELFGNLCEVPNLEQMFEVKKKTYSKRTSSANWQSPRSFR